MPMSAIAGAVNLPVSEEAEKTMLQTMKRRGPDAESVYRQKECTLLHTDRHGVRGYVEMPELDWNGERYVLSFDGTVFNREELCHELHESRNLSDGALVLRAYAAWKEEMLEKINGVFALAIFEEKTGTLFLARDRIGVKPLFYMEHENGLLFASEMKTILSYPGVRAELDGEGAAEILLLGPGRTPGSGVFYNMREIRPGYCAVYQGGNLRLRRYWQLTDRIHEDSLEETAEKVAYLLKDATKRQMKAETPVGAMLSGGLDSSLVCAIASRLLDARGEQLITFSVDYADSEKYFTPGFFQPSRDTDFVRIMQEVLDSHHRWTVLSPEELVNNLADATIARDLPGMADVDSSLLAFCAGMKQHTDVVLSGECSDEIFGGCPWYREQEMRNYDGFPWAQTTAQRASLAEPWIFRDIQPEEFVHSRYTDTIRESDILPENTAVDRRTKELVNLNFAWFMQTLLDRGDRMSAWHGLDVRMPYCDYRIAEYLYTVPWSMKDYRGQEKGLLRYALRDMLPGSVLYRKKSPYPKTYDPRYEEMVTQLLQALLQQKDAPLFALVRREKLQSLMQEPFAWPWYGQLMRRPQTIAYMLQINFWLEHYSVRIK